MWEFETHKQEFFFLIQVLGTFYEFHNHYNALFYFKLKQNRLAHIYSLIIKSLNDKWGIQMNIKLVTSLFERELPWDSHGQ